MVRHLIAAAALTVFGASAAFAQITVPKPIVTPDGQSSTNRARRAVEAPPSAVPGARADTSLTAPAERSLVDMPPTEALFDSINRGDIISAREAISRGADIHGRNILGLTPLEQSVDLGRNDISFLLLSLRGGEGYNTAAGPRGGRPPADPRSPQELRAERQANAKAEAAARRQQLADERTNRATPTAPHNARLFAGDGGAPVPQAGFLGFDSAR